MNIKMFQTRLNSIDHYDSEVKELEEVIVAVKKTRSELLLSLAEFFPFTEGMIIMRDEKFYKILPDPVQVWKYPDVIKYKIKVLIPVSNHFKHREDLMIPVDEIDKYKIIKP